MDEDVARLLLAPVEPDPEFILAAEQCRAGRALLYWSQGKLARRACVAKSTVLDFETGRHTPLAANRRRIRDALVAAGIVFVDAGEDSGHGACLARQRRRRRPKVRQRRADRTPEVILALEAVPRFK